jgi:hypothetical protein|tara:strand:+ start:121 stop:537 length:417 start_codon:yes stop_codon:yes gene_type:complete
MLNGLYETSPDQKIKTRVQKSYSLEITVNRAFKQSFMTWVSVEDSDDIMKPYRRFTGGKILNEDMLLLKNFFNEQADGVITEKQKAMKYIKDNFTHDFDKNHFVADPKLFCKVLQEQIDHCESDRKIVNEILTLKTYQ